MIGELKCSAKHFLGVWLGTVNKRLVELEDLGRRIAKALSEGVYVTKDE